MQNATARHTTSATSNHAPIKSGDEPALNRQFAQRTRGHINLVAFEKEPGQSRCCGARELGSVMPASIIDVSLDDSADLCIMGKITLEFYSGQQKWYRPSMPILIIDGLACCYIKIKTAAPTSLPSTPSVSQSPSPAQIHIDLAARDGIVGTQDGCLHSFKSEADVLQTGRLTAS